MIYPFVRRRKTPMTRHTIFLDFWTAREISMMRASKFSVHSEVLFVRILGGMMLQLLTGLFGMRDGVA